MVLRIILFLLFTITLSAQQTNPILYDWTTGGIFSGPLELSYLPSSDTTFLVKYPGSDEVDTIGIAQLKKVISLGGIGNQDLQGVLDEGSSASIASDFSIVTPNVQLGRKSLHPIYSAFSVSTNPPSGFPNVLLMDSTINITAEQSLKLGGQSVNLTPEIFIFNPQKSQNTPAATDSSFVTKSNVQGSLDNLRKVETPALPLKVQIEAQAIRNNAGVPTTVDTGNIEGTTVGLLATARVDTQKITITQESDASAIASSGNGTKAAPYVIRDYAMNNSESTSTPGGFEWNDSDADYYIKLVNFDIGNYDTYQARSNTPTKLIIENCRFFGDETGSKGVVSDNGELSVKNNKFDGLGDINIQQSGYPVKTSNNLFTKDFGTASNIPDYLIDVTGNKDVEIFNNEVVNNSGRGFVKLNNSCNLFFEKNIIDTLTSTPNNVIFFDYTNQEKTKKSIIKFNYVDAHVNKFTTQPGDSVFNFYAAYNSFSGKADDGVFGNTSALVYSYNCWAVNNFFSSDYRTYSNGREAICFSGAENCVIANNYTDIWFSDYLELYNPEGNNYVMNNVGDTVRANIVDLFSSEGDFERQYNNNVFNIYGTSLGSWPIITTSTDNITVGNIYCNSLNNEDYISSVLFEQRSFDAGGSPKNNIFIGGNLDSSYNPSGNVFNTTGSLDTNGSNQAYYIQGEKLYTYNIDERVLDRFDLSDTIKTYHDTIPDVSGDGTIVKIYQFKNGIEDYEVNAPQVPFSFQGLMRDTNRFHASDIPSNYMQEGENVSLLNNDVPYADDADVVHKSGDETITGNKIFDNSVTTFVGGSGNLNRPLSLVGNNNDVSLITFDASIGGSQLGYIGLGESANNNMHIKSNDDVLLIPGGGDNAVVDQGDFEVPNPSFFYYGDESTNGTFRIGTSNGNIVIEERIAGIYEELFSTANNLTESEVDSKIAATTDTNVVDGGFTYSLPAKKGFYSFTGSTSTWTLPAVSNSENVVYYIKNKGSGTLTINADSGNNEIYSSSAVNSYDVTAGSAIILHNDTQHFNVQ